MATINKIILKEPVTTANVGTTAGNAIEFSGEPGVTTTAMKKVTVTTPAAPGLKTLSVGSTTIKYTGNRG